MNFVSKNIDLSKIRIPKFKPARSKEEKIDFKCPLCGCEEYQVVSKISDVVGLKNSCAIPMYYFCVECTVMFQDPSAFSAKK